MEKIVEIDVNSYDDLFERYNRKKISRDLIGYLITNTPKLRKDDKLKIVINNNMKENISCSELIKRELDAETVRVEVQYKHNNFRQLRLLILGVITLIIASFVGIEILNEVVVIGAWVLIWEMVEIEMDDDVSNRKKKNILKRLVASDFEEIKK